MTKESSRYPEPAWKSDLTLEYELAQARARREVWQPRYEQFSSQVSQHSSDTRASVIYSADDTSPLFDWMRPENLGDYVLYRLDRMERGGGSETEKAWLREIASAGRGRLYEGGEYLVSLRVSQLDREIAYWGQESYTEFAQVRNALNSEHPAQRRFLSPRQQPLVQALERRADRYNDPQWQRWIRKARARRPAHRG